jgi:hypothetical protein
MRATFCAVVFVVVIGLCSSSAFALDYANDASASTYNNATVSNVGFAAGGTAETDDQRASLAYSGSAGTNGRVNITFTFPTWSLAAGDHSVFLIVDGTPTGAVWAQVREINGTRNIGTQNKSITGTNLQDGRFRLKFNLSSATDVSTVLIRFTLNDGGSGSTLSLDAVATPEPGTFLLFGLGALGLGYWGHRRKKKA